MGQGGVGERTHAHAHDRDHATASRHHLRLSIISVFPLPESAISRRKVRVELRKGIKVWLLEMASNTSARLERLLLMFFAYKWWCREQTMCDLNGL